MTTVCAAILAATFAIALPVSLAANSPQSPGHSTRKAAQAVGQNEMIWWFPADTESLVVARGPFPIPTNPNETGERNEQEWFTRQASNAEIRIVFEQIPLELFYGPDLDLARALKGDTVAYAMQGSRHFREPTDGSDGMVFEGCSIVVFDRDLDGLANVTAKMPSRKGASAEIIDGTRVLILNQDSEFVEENDFIAIPQPNIIVVANNRQYLQEVLERMTQRKASRALPDQLPEWRLLDPNARFWGLRHYDPTQAKMDPTSPLGGNGALSRGDPKAIGVLYALDPGNERSLVITSLSGDGAKVRAEASTGQFVAEPQGGVKYVVKLRSSHPGVLEQSYTLDRTSTLDYSLLDIEFALGRGMYF
jgi:hypothetical protein